MIAGKADDYEACQRLMAIPGIGPMHGDCHCLGGWQRRRVPGRATELFCLAGPDAR